VHIADTPEEFAAAIDTAIKTDSPQRLMEVDSFLKQTSWDRTWSQMSDLIAEVCLQSQSAEETETSAEGQRVMVAGV
jgi:hypothetical protein